MRISVIGSGKTGSKVVELLGAECHHIFNEEKPVDSEKLKESDAVIIFVPGNAVASILDDVVQANIPAVWGSTGYDWPADLSEKIKLNGNRWLIASNFSLGMNIIRKAIQIISKGADILNDVDFKMHEIHHLQKLDAPSGTALSWKEWLGRDIDITHERVGDVKGIHEIELSTPYESIKLKHEALDRAVFASGAIWATHQLIARDDLFGMYQFSEIFDQIYKELDNE